VTDHFSQVGNFCNSGTSPASGHITLIILPAFLPSIGVCINPHTSMQSPPFNIVLSLSSRNILQLWFKYTTLYNIQYPGHFPAYHDGSHLNPIHYEEVYRTRRTTAPLYSRLAFLESQERMEFAGKKHLARNYGQSVLRLGSHLSQV